jgi:hypothetical protein
MIVKPEKLAYTRYYEHDGLLRAYANRAMVLAILFGVIALASLGFAIFVRLQPPTVVRVDPDGMATAVSAPSGPEGGPQPLFHVAAASETGPTELEAKGVVRRFLEVYLNYTPATAERSFAEALNMMTGNLRNYTLQKLREEETVQKIKEGNIVSAFKLRDMEAVKGVPYQFMAFGVREVRLVKNGIESMDRIVSRHNLRLAVTKRSEHNPSGLLVAEYWEQQILGDRNSGPVQSSVLSE